MDRSEALALFDSSPTVQPDELMGAWAGSEMPTGHRLDGVLEALGWQGKRFEDDELAHPLVFADARGEFLVDPARISSRLLPHIGVLGRGAVGSAMTHATRRGLLRLAATHRPCARLRVMEHRGVVGTAMVYDSLPIIDHFRRLDDQTLLGLMDARGMEPLFFQLRRR